MFQRLITGHAEAACTIVAFAVAAGIFVAVAWRALRMKSPQADRMSQLPFDTATPASQSHERTDKQRAG